MRHLSALWLMLSFAMGCGSTAMTPKQLEPGPDVPRAGDAGLAAALLEARAGIGDERLAALLVDHWRWTLEQDPLFATRLGVRDFDHLVPDGSKRAIEARKARRRELLGRAKAIDPKPLAPQDRLSLSLLSEGLEDDIASEVCRFEEWSVSPRNNPVTEWNNLPEVHKVASSRDAINLLARYLDVARSIDDEILLLSEGAAKGWFATAESLRRIALMADKQLAQPTRDWPMMTPVEKLPGDLAADAKERLVSKLTHVVEHSIRPALGRYRDFIKGTLLPKGRGDEDAGVAALPHGVACYRAQIKAFTTLALEADAIHELGVRESARIDAEIAALGSSALGAASLAETLTKLRSDPALYYGSAEEIEREATEALALAKEKMPAFFGVLPKADCVVRRIPDYEAPFTTMAYYRPPHTDGTKPGEYFVNVYLPEKRPRYEARVLALHEAIPGHHLQIAIAQELAAVPAFRKHGFINAYIEGWALYTERLGEEMGMYRTDLDRMGMLSFDAWRAARLVVDTGIHAQGWSRQRAKRYLEEHTALSPDNIDNEVDRYINWPGQALGYKIGQLEIAELRAGAERELGSGFSVAAFHDAVLGSGAVTLTILREQVRAAMAKRATP